MELIPPKITASISNTHRLIPSRYPPVGIFDEISSPADLDILFNLESWTNDRIGSELGQLHSVPTDQWVVGIPNSTIIMAAFCHPSPKGGRFNTPQLGAWYAALELETAIEETIFHRTKEFLEVGYLHGTVCMRQYLADFDADFHDIREPKPEYQPLYDPESYAHSQNLSEFLRKIDSNGILYNSIRHSNGQCVVTFKPRLVSNVRQGMHLEYNWSGSERPTVTQLPDDEPS